MGEIQLPLRALIAGVAGEPGGPGLAVLIVVQQAVTGQILGLSTPWLNRPGCTPGKIAARQRPDEIRTAVHRAGAVGDRQIDVFPGAVASIGCS
jgi:hypothetical protein